MGLGYLRPKGVKIVRLWLNHAASHPDAKFKIGEAAFEITDEAARTLAAEKIGTQVIEWVAITITLGGAAAVAIPREVIVAKNVSTAVLLYITAVCYKLSLDPDCHLLTKQEIRKKAQGMKANVYPEMLHAVKQKVCVGAAWNQEKLQAQLLGVLPELVKLEATKGAVQAPVL
jgi:hypothetical protein